MEIAVLLDGYLAEVLAEPAAFNWSRYNCAHFAGGWVLLATGRDCLDGLADVPDGRAARRVLARMGVGTLAGAVSQRMGWPPYAGAMAKVGDVVLVESTTNGARLLGAALGVCAGRTVRMLGHDGSLVCLDLASARLAWPLADGRAEALMGAAA